MNQLSLLKRHKAYALALLILLFFLWLSAKHWQQASPIWPYVKAFAEAGMVGGLADWFAVSALFRHPFGIKIPHTNLIEKSQQKIGDNLALFVSQNFLNPSTIGHYLQNFNIANYVLKQLDQEQLINKILQQGKSFLQQMLKESDDEKMEAMIYEKILNFAQSKSADFMLADLSQYALKQGWTEQLLNYLCGEISQLILMHEELIIERVEAESYTFMPDFINQKIARKICDGLASYLIEIKTNPKHPVKKGIEQQLMSFAESLHSLEGNPKVNQFKTDLSQAAWLKKMSHKMWQESKQYLQNHLQDEHQAWEIKLKDMMLNYVHKLSENQEQQAKINHFLSEKILSVLSTNNGFIQKLIGNTIGQWESRSLSNKLELMVGKDLQYIRINGSLVGGLVGLLIFCLEQWMG